MGSSMRQLSLLEAGCQPWNLDVCDGDNEMFAYCATLAVYIYSKNSTGAYDLHSIMCEHKKTITAMSWSPHGNGLIATASADGQVIVWDVRDQTLAARIEGLQPAASCLDWLPHDPHCLTYLSGCGPVNCWNFRVSPHNQGLTNSSAYLHTAQFTSPVTLYRWHHTSVGRLALGHLDGSLSLLISTSTRMGGKGGSPPAPRLMKHILRPVTPPILAEVGGANAVVSLEWDPHSADYVLIANSVTGIRLVDCQTGSELSAFATPGSASRVACAEWIPRASGLFVSADATAGILRIWNVSQSQPLESVRLKKGGLHALKVISSSPANISDGAAGAGEGGGGGGGGGGLALPSCRVLCAFVDGGVGLFDLQRRAWIHLRDLGHIETIFDCRFRPDNADLVATASFDGTVKLWNITDMTCQSWSPGNEGVVYCVSWAPSGGLLAAATAKNGVFIWDSVSGVVTGRFFDHGRNQTVYCVAWSRACADRIASGGSDCCCVVRSPAAAADGVKVIQRYRHPAPVYGCDWNPTNRDILCTACEDHRVRVFYLVSGQDQPLRVFAGHKAKVFQVRWSPLRDGWMCSGSDDETVRLWNYSARAPPDGSGCGASGDRAGDNGPCFGVLQGHTGPVRGLHWSDEVPSLLLTGSWDHTVRLWDVRSGSCIEVVRDHAADVYGIAAHPTRPFLICTSSRDSTLRLWTMAPLLGHLDGRVLAGGRLSDISASVDDALKESSLPKLCGSLSRTLTDSSRLEFVRSIINAFQPPESLQNFWDLLSLACGTDVSMLDANYGTGVVHVKHMEKFSLAKAQTLEHGRSTSLGIGAPSRDSRLQQAADLHLSLGNLRKYCDIQVELGQWDRALAVAPAVSSAHWRSLCVRRAELLARAGNPLCLPLAIAAGQPELAAHFHRGRGNHSEVLLLRHSADRGQLPVSRDVDNHCQPQPPQSPTATTTSTNTDACACSESTRRAAIDLAHACALRGQSVKAACYHLAVDDPTGAVDRLVAGNQLSLALYTCLRLPQTDSRLPDIADRLCRRAQNSQRWELSIELARCDPHTSRDLLSRVCASCCGSREDVDAFHQQAGLPSVADCAQRASEAERAGDTWEAVRLHLLSDRPDHGLALGLRHVREIMSGSWSVDDLQPKLKLLASIRSDRLQTLPNERDALLFLCSYVGALDAWRRGFHSVVKHLFNHTLKFTMRQELDVPFKTQTVLNEKNVYLIQQQKSEPLAALDHVVKNKLGRIDDLDRGEIVLAGSSLPSHADTSFCHFTGRPIRGAVFHLEDGKSAVSLNQALMWAAVNPFSPLGSGARICPF